MKKQANPTTKSKIVYLNLSIPFSAEHLPKAIHRVFIDLSHRPIPGNVSRPFAAAIRANAYDSLKLPHGRLLDIAVAVAGMLTNPIDFLSNACGNVECDISMSPDERKKVASYLQTAVGAELIHVHANAK